jgi:hypothetical protein
MATNDDRAAVYVSPDGEHEMTLSSPAAQINWETRGWTRKDGRSPLSTSPSTDQAKRPAARRREAADE